MDNVDNLVDKSIYRHFSIFLSVDNYYILSTFLFLIFIFCKFMYIILFILHNFHLKILFSSVFHYFLKTLLLFDKFPIILSIFFPFLLYFFRNSKQNTPAKMLKSLRLNTKLLIFFTGNSGKRI